MVEQEPTETGRDFASLGLDARLVKALATLGYEEPTPIQCRAIPPLLEGRDLIGQAATGTGKTAAFALPLLQRLAVLKKPGRPSALILVPTRELAMQVSEAVHRYGRAFGTSVLPVYGGQSFGPQFRALERGVDVVVATPGRALDHVRRLTMVLGGVSVVVLDEADEMLDMGFAEDIEAILAETPALRQTMLFSVTLPPRILTIARRHLRDPVEIKVARERVAAGQAPRVRQTAYVVSRPHKIAALGRVLDMESPASALVFCRTRLEVDELAEKLGARGYRAEALHGGMTQDARERVMKKLRAGAADLIIATDVAARGLDIEQLSHVFNYDVPSAPESYIHRTGRVGRAGREGIAITLAEPRELWQLRNIEKLTRQKIEFATLPTTADLQAKRLELTRAALQELLLEGGLEQFRVVVESLGQEHEVFDIALAAVKMAHAAGGNAIEEKEDIPTPRLSTEGSGRDRVASRGGARGRGAGVFGAVSHGASDYGARDSGGRDRGAGDRTVRIRGARVPGAGQLGAKNPAVKRRGTGDPDAASPLRARADRIAAARDRTRNQAGASPGLGMVRLHVDLGRESGVRPQDLVGAITNEAGVTGRAVGAIEISDRHSVVEVAEEVAVEVMGALRRALIRGKRPAVRRL
jgi:ATP-dependent RNA helicase DeaD